MYPQGNESTIMHCYYLINCLICSLSLLVGGAWLLTLQSVQVLTGFVGGGLLVLLVLDCYYLMAFDQLSVFTCRRSVANFFPISSEGGPRPRMVWWERVMCPMGNESTILDCYYPGWGDRDCRVNEDAAIRCMVATTAGELFLVLYRHSVKLVMKKQTMIWLK